APSTVTAATRRQSTTTTPAAMRPSVTLQVPVPSRHTLRWAIPVLVLLLAGWLTRGKWLHRGGGSSGPDPRNIAVLYFDDGSTGKSLGYLVSGLTESLIYELGQVGSLNVISRYGVAPYKNSSVTNDSLARALKVGTVVRGTVSESGNRLRVTVDMINTANGRLQSSGPIERDREDPFGLQDALASQISQFLRTRLGQVVQQIQIRAGTKNAAAWELVQKARTARETADSLSLAGDTTTAKGLLSSADSQLTAATRMDSRWSLP